MNDRVTYMAGLTWVDLNREVYTLTEDEALAVLRAEAGRDVPRNMHMKRLYGRFATLRRRRESAELGIRWTS